MKPEDLQRLVTVNMPYGKYQGRLIADVPISRGLPAKVFRLASWATCWR
jgi:hypothetical protein